MSSNKYMDGGQWLLEKCLNCLAKSEVEKKNGGQTTTNQRPAPEKNTNNNKREADLLNFVDNFSTSLRIKDNNNIRDMQMKELLDFVKTSGKNNNICGLTPEEEKQYKMFFDKFETEINLDNNRNKNVTAQETLSSSFYRLNEDYIGTPKVLTPQIIEINYEDDHKVNEDLIDEVLLDKNIEKHNARITTSPRYYEDKTASSNKPKMSDTTQNENSFTSDFDLMDEIIKSNPIDFNAATRKEDNKTTYSNNDTINITKEIPKQYPPVNTDDLVTKCDIKYLESMIMDEKLKKLSVLKTEHEKLYLTSGPTLREKSIVLPQIMKRLADKKRELEEEGDMSRRFVLDAGLSNQKIDEDNNKSYQTSHTDWKVPSGEKTLGASFTRTNNNAASNIFNSSRSPKANATAANCFNDNGDKRFVSIEQLKELQNKRKDYIKIGPHVLTPPDPLVKDCNKDRFVSYATSHLFNDFVHRN